ncbi:hypothetical protein E4U41_007404 [Claviceps citrina]|nr:hypothetical protein E4U41_007404 [Claviceps citrina]
MALASALLKRHAITSSCPDLPWSAARFTRDARTKPVFRLPDGSEPLLFNVSHQAGLVCLVAVLAPPPPVVDDHDDTTNLAVGVDVACPSERRARDHALVSADGWRSFVEMHDSVFSPGESARLGRLPFGDRGLDLDRKLGYFYALWCLREAYVKMTGEALLAEWLRDLELRYFAPPGETGPEGRGLEIWFKGARVEHVHVRMDWYLDEYMICTAVRGNQHAGLDFGSDWTLLDIDELLAAAERANAR